MALSYEHDYLASIPSKLHGKIERAARKNGTKFSPVLILGHMMARMSARGHQLPTRKSSNTFHRMASYHARDAWKRPRQCGSEIRPGEPETFVTMACERSSRVTCGHWP